jgi:hypothetical protein
MNSERTGEQVFGNIDEALAEKIISRSRENSGTAGVYPAANNIIKTDNVTRYGREPAPVAKLLMPAALALLLLLLLVLGRGRTGRNTNYG